MIPEIKSMNPVDVIGRFTTLRKVAAHEWAGQCPRCGGRDRFRVNDEKGYFCRHCQGEPGSGGHWGDCLDFMQWAFNLSFRDALHRLGVDRKATPDEIARLTAERKARQDEQQRQEQAEQAQVHDRLTNRPEWRTYAENLKTHAIRELWHRRGLPDRWIDYYAVGYCPTRRYPGDFDSDSLTIPYFRPVWKPDGDFDHWHCIGLQHRLLKPDPPGGKYRPHLAGAGKHLFWSDLFQSRWSGDLLVVEGEIKAMVTWSTLWIDDTPLAPNLSVVGVPGKGWKEEWIATFRQAQRVLVCLDPDATDSAKRLVKLIGDKAKLILLPDKIDDLITSGVLNADSLLKILEV